ncbi:MAG: class I SAM-dependent methyltransferase [Candidatus Dormibacteraeota bacterium]|nr:class I SAM-dependent methyltransferase [Candidatus Dormibacteraeota bacterium]
MADPSVFSCFSVESIAAVYEDIYVPRIFIPWARLLVERAGLRAGESVLDVATGPGTVARLAAEDVGPKGRVVATDISPAMVDIARRKPRLSGGAEIHYVVSPAAPLTAPGAAFDVVTCQQGLQFFPDRGAAIREMFRVLRPGGRIVVAVWREIALQPIFDAINTALHECLPADAVAPYAAPFRWSSGQELASALRGQGFRDVTVEEHRLPVVYEGGVAQAMATLAASPVASLVSEMAGEKQVGLWKAGQRHLEPLLEGGQLRAEMVSNIGTARKAS